MVRNVLERKKKSIKWAKGIKQKNSKYHYNNNMILNDFFCK